MRVFRALYYINWPTCHSHGTRLVCAVVCTWLESLTACLYVLLLLSSPHIDSLSPVHNICRWCGFYLAAHAEDRKKCGSDDRYEMRSAFLMIIFIHHTMVEKNRIT